MNINYYAIPGIKRTKKSASSVETLKEHTAAFFGITVAKLESKRSLKELVKARFFLYHYGHRVKRYSLCELARATNKNDHTSVFYGVNVVDDLCSVDIDYKKEMNNYIVYMDSQKN